MVGAGQRNTALSLTRRCRTGSCQRRLNPSGGIDTGRRLAPALRVATVWRRRSPRLWPSERSVSLIDPQETGPPSGAVSLNTGRLVDHVVVPCRTPTDHPDPHDLFVAPVDVVPEREAVSWVKGGRILRFPLLSCLRQRSWPEPGSHRLVQRLRAMPLRVPPTAP